MHYLLLIYFNNKVYYWNKLILNSAFSLFILYGYITTYGQQNIKLELCTGIIFHWSERLPEDYTPVPKHVGD